MKSAKQIFRDGKNWTVKHSPQILTVVGVGTMVYAGYRAVKKTPLALDLIEEEKEKRLAEWPASTITEEQAIEVTTLKPVDIVKTCWKVYAPEVLMAAVGAGCIFGGNSISTKRTAALATAYTLSETALKEFKNKAVEVIGEKKVETINEEVVKEKIKADPPKESNVIITPQGGETLFCDSLSMRYFKMDISKRQKAENQLNLVLRNQDYCSVNYLYDLFGIEHTELGRLLGWNINRSGYITIKPIPSIVNDESSPYYGQPCIYLDYGEMPEYDFSSYM